MGTVTNPTPNTGVLEPIKKVGGGCFKVTLVLRRQSAGSGDVCELLKKGCAALHP